MQVPVVTQPMADETPPTITPTDIETQARELEIDEGTTYGFTHQNPDGNRWVRGSGSVPDINPVKIPLSGTPEWLVGSPFRQGSLWVVTLSDGHLEAFYLEEGYAQPVALSTNILTRGAPPLLLVHENGVWLIAADVPEASRSTHPVFTDESGTMTYISDQGDLVLLQGDERSKVSVNALPDARILSDGDGRILFLAGATDRYAHAVVGDHLEASQILLYETVPSMTEILRITIPSPKVIEGIMPLWVDLDGDGSREIIVTTSDSDVGARFEVYDESGLLVAASEPIGVGFRWRHQLAVAPFGPDGGIELATVRTPHIGGVVEFFSMAGSQLVKEAELRGYTSHIIGSRNLDMAVAGDFDSDGRIELLLPDQSLRSLGAIRRTEEGTEVVWSLDLDGKLTTNLAAVTLENDSLILGAATQDGHLWLWAP